MTREQLQAICQEQENYLQELSSTSLGGKQRRGKYRQILRAEGSWWVDVYDGPYGVGYVVCEKRVTAEGVVETRCTDFGPEARTTSWAPEALDPR